MTVLATEYSGRSVFHPSRYEASAAYLFGRLADAGLEPRREAFRTRDIGAPSVNIVADIPGTSAADEIVVVGAHYDAVMGQPGADDNASGCAAVVELARMLEPGARTVRLVLFANEEPPHFMTGDMGSHVHAEAASAAGERIVAMVSLEMLGYYDTTPGSQKYPPGIGMLYPDTGDFIAFVGLTRDRGLVKRAVGTFRETTAFPAYGAALPAGVPGVAFSDHWSFAEFGYPAIMATDTAMFRNPHYHRDTDTPETLDYERMARVTEGIARVVAELASRP